jgi:hypothetical protein
MNESFALLLLSYSGSFVRFCDIAFVRLCYVILPSSGSVYMSCLDTLAIFHAKVASVSRRLLGFLVCCAHLSFVIRPKKHHPRLRPFG